MSDRYIIKRMGIVPYKEWYVVDTFNPLINVQRCVSLVHAEQVARHNNELWDEYITEQYRINEENLFY